jgi:hypothetical protein
MRGYKHRRSAINISRLLAWCGNRLDRGGVAADPGLRDRQRYGMIAAQE